MGIGVHQMAILRGSEVAYVERALVRAPAAFLGFEARKEGHHFRSCKPGLCLAFVLLHAPQLFHGAIRRLFRGPRNKKSGQDATFLRLRIVGWCQYVDRGLKNAVNSCKTALFPLCGNGRESVIEKKLQKRQDFCFCDGRRLP